MANNQRNVEQLARTKVEAPGVEESSWLNNFHGSHSSSLLRSSFRLV